MNYSNFVSLLIGLETYSLISLKEFIPRKIRIQVSDMQLGVSSEAPMLI